MKVKQKICIIAALIHNPKLWVLDEPLMGLDPQSAYDIKCYMKEHKRLGNTVFFSSHNIDMVEKLCDRVAIINKGHLVEIIDVEDFMANSKVSLEEYFLELTKDEISINDQLAEANKSKKKKKFSFPWFKKKKQEEKDVLEEILEKTKQNSENAATEAEENVPSDKESAETKKEDNETTKEGTSPKKRKKTPKKEEVK